MKYFNTIRVSLLLLIFVISFCNGNKQEVEKLDEFELLIEDSLVVYYPGILKIVDFDKESSRFLAVDNSRGNKVILILDGKGQVIKSFDSNNEGENSFKGNLNSLRFVPGNKGYFVLSDAGFYLYNNDWKVVSFIENKNKKPKFLNPHFNLEFFTTKENTLFISSYNFNNNGLSYKEGKFFDKVQNLTLIDTSSGSFDTFLNFEAGSIYLDKSRVFPPYFTYFSTDNSSGSLFVLYSQDPTIYEYRFKGEQFEIFNKIQLSLDDFRLKEENYLGIDYDAFKTALDSRINRFITFEDYFFVTYSKPMDHDKFTKLGIDYADSDAYRDFVFSNHKEALAIYNRGLKVCKDIILPDYLTGPSLALGPDRLLMSPPKFRYEYEYEKFYIVKVKPKL